MMADKFIELLMNGMKRLASLFGDIRKRHKRAAANQSETYTE